MHPSAFTAIILNNAYNFKEYLPGSSFFIFYMTTQFFSAILLSMIIRKALRTDADRIMEIYASCTAVQQQQGISQWSEEYPNKRMLHQDIRQGRAYVAVESIPGTVIGVIVLAQGETDEEHQHIKWKLKNSPAVFLSRLAVDPEHQNSGIGSHLMDFAEHEAIRNGFCAIRLDADRQQELLFTMYKNRGYKVQGSVWYDDPPKEFYAMEKQLPRISIHWAAEKELPKIFEIRETVFIEGQQVNRELEQDGLDDRAKHVILYEEDFPVGCARIRWVSMEIEGSKPSALHYWKVERLAVLEQARQKGYGKLIMEWIEKQAKTQQVAGLTLHAQQYLEEFYKSLGFETAEKPFMEAGIPHVHMIKKLTVS